jgi:hypothetical protein
VRDAPKPVHVRAPFAEVLFSPENKQFTLVVVVGLQHRGGAQQTDDKGTTDVDKDKASGEFKEIVAEYLQKGSSVHSRSRRAGGRVALEGVSAGDGARRNSWHP